MKKIIAILALFVLMTGAAFGQFYLDIGYSFGSSSAIDIYSMSTNLSDPSVPRGETAFTSRPGIGFGVDMGNYDFIGSIIWMVDRVSVGFADLNVTAQGFGLYGGIAWKATASDRLTLSFPIQLKFLRSGYTFVETDPSLKITVYANTFGIDAGARAHLDINEGWGIYAGFQLGIMEFMGKPRVRARASGGGSNSVSLDMTGFSLFPGGTINLGVTYSF